MANRNGAATEAQFVLQFCEGTHDLSNRYINQNNDEHIIRHKLYSLQIE